MMMKKNILLGIIANVLIFQLSVNGQISNSESINLNNEEYSFYPEMNEDLPKLSSPFIKEGQEIIISFTNDNTYYLFPVTIENGKDNNYQDRIWYEKGKQLTVDSVDFPILASKGTHSILELEKCNTITAKPISEITTLARPGNYSGIGFIAEDETIISVLKGDNLLVEKLNFKHIQLARPLFHVYNMMIILAKDKKSIPELSKTKGIYYNEHKIYLNWKGAKGWQNSIFNDEILGYWEIEIWRDITRKELNFLKQEYSDLSEKEFENLVKKLSYMHIGEMVPYYITRYGFYEGHTNYRADPIAISFIFGLKSIQEINSTFNGDIYNTLINHFKD